MSKVKKIYLDMDGVFCDFDARWFDTFGRTPKESRNNKEFSPDWEEFITGKNFTDLPWTDGGKELFEFILSLPADIQVFDALDTFEVDAEDREFASAYVKGM